MLVEATLNPLIQVFLSFSKDPRYIFLPHYKASVGKTFFLKANQYGISQGTAFWPSEGADSTSATCPQWSDTLHDSP